MLDPRYLRYMSLLMHAEQERKPAVVEENETQVYAQIIRDQDQDAAA